MCAPLTPHEASSPGRVLVEMSSICKTYPGVDALQDVSFRVRKGEIRALMGENGAGKSTLVRMLTGAEPITSGRITVDGHAIEKMSPAVSERLGIACVYQNLVLAEHLTVAENIRLGHIPSCWGFVGIRALRRQTEEVLDEIGYRGTLDPDVRVGALSASQQGMVAIARAVARKARIVIFDEPTAVLADREVDELFRVIRELKKRRLAVIYISHRMEEIFDLCDTITVLKDGRNAGEARASDVDEHRIIAMMVGRELAGSHYDGTRKTGGELLRAEGLSNARIRDCSFSLRGGEIVGVYGLVGAGRTELSRALFGRTPVKSGRMFVGGKRERFRGARQAIDKGLSLIPEDRRRHGLALQLSVEHNLNLVVYRKQQVLGFIRRKRERETGNRFVNQLAIRTPGPRQLVKNLSGGNQQKVVVGKWLANNSRVFIMDEPTNGIDVGAKEEIYGLMNRLARDGAGILFISSYMPELMDICDRILVMKRGRMVGDVERKDFDEQALLRLAIGSEEKEAVNT